MRLTRDSDAAEYEERGEEGGQEAVARALAHAHHGREVKESRAGRVVVEREVAGHHDTDEAASALDKGVVLSRVRRGDKAPVSNTGIQAEVQEDPAPRLTSGRMLRTLDVTVLG